MVVYITDSTAGVIKLRLSPRLDNFYEKIGVKTLGLLYPTVCRLQVPKSQPGKGDFSNNHEGRLQIS